MSDLMSRLYRWAENAKWDGPFDKQWDYWRSQIATGQDGSAPRDWFQSITDSMAEDATEAATQIDRLTAENERLREALSEMLPRYCEMFSALALGDPEIDSVAVQIARAALDATDDPR